MTLEYIVLALGQLGPTNQTLGFSKVKDQGQSFNPNKICSKALDSEASVQLMQKYWLSQGHLTELKGTKRFALEIDSAANKANDSIE